MPLASAKQIALRSAVSATDVMVCLNSRGTPNDGGGGSTSNRRNNRRSISQFHDLGQSRARYLGRHRLLGRHRHRDLEPVPR